MKSRKFSPDSNNSNDYQLVSFIFDEFIQYLYGTESLSILRNQLL